MSAHCCTVTISSCVLKLTLKHMSTFLYIYSFVAVNNYGSSCGVYGSQELGLMQKTHELVMAVGRIPQGNVLALDNYSEEWFGGGIGVMK